VTEAPGATPDRDEDGQPCPTDSHGDTNTGSGSSGDTGSGGGDATGNGRADLDDRAYQQILSFRTALRRFLHWSERQSEAVGLTATQHQLLLAIRGHPDPRGPTTGELAGYLLIRHHSAVSLVDRAELAGWVVRHHDTDDRRVVRVTLTPRGADALARLTNLHLTELRSLGRELAPFWDGLRGLPDDSTASDVPPPGPIRQATSVESQTEQTDTRIVVTATVPAAPVELFAVLADPRRHPEIDGSGMVRGAVTHHPLTAVGDVFTMEMHYPSLGDYRTDNHVVELEPGRRIAWTTARQGQPPAGVVWRWELAPAGDDGSGTRVTHTYDWSGVTDPAVKARVKFPRVSADQLVATIDRLAAAAAGTPT